MRINERAIDRADDPPPKVTPEIAAEAATWVARLHGSNRSREMELQCLDWQARSAAHRHAFERCTEVWMEAPNVARAVGYVPVPRPVPGEVRKAVNRGPKVFAITTVSALILVFVVLGSWTFWPDGDEYRTAKGEAQTVVLADGTRMYLNTDTRVHVDYRKGLRRVNLTGGEVAFDVAKDAARPFIVRAAASEVVALGTSFTVRLTPSTRGVDEYLSVTLIEGKVSFRPAAGGGGQAVAPAETVVMHPGERVLLTKAPGGAATHQQVDHPVIDQVTAWRRNEVVFDKTSLMDAVTEMNRYGRTPIVLAASQGLADRLISGVYRTGDNASFARAVAALHGLAVHEQKDRIALTELP